MTKAELIKNYRTLYDHLRVYEKEKLVKHFGNIRTRLCGYSKETCINTAKNFNNFTEWVKNCNGAYQAAIKNGWLDDVKKIYRHTKKRKKYKDYKIELLNLAKKGLQKPPAGTNLGAALKTLTNINSPRFDSKFVEDIKNINPEYLLSYSEILKKKKAIEEEVRKKKKSDITISKVEGSKWGTLKKCEKEAKKFKTKGEWRSKSNSSFNSAKKNGWLDICSQHMSRGITEARKVKNLTTKKVYDSISDAARYNEISSPSLIRQAIYKNCKSGGCRWAYCDEDGNVIE